MTLGTVPSSSVSSELKLIWGSFMSLTLLVALTYWIFFCLAISVKEGRLSQLKAGESARGYEENLR